MGITFEGMIEVFKRIDFLKQKKSPKGGTKPEEFFDEDWTYYEYYARNPNDQFHKRLSDELVGPIGDCPMHGRKNMTGYDCCVYIRSWLGQKHIYKSLVEVVLTDDTFKDLRKHVGTLHVKISGEGLALSSGWG